MTVVVDLFAGPGGWDVGAVELGLDPLGIEWDDAACRVREAAGLRTLQADVAALNPKDFPCDLLIASPPCTAFSMAGKGEGRRALDTLLAAVVSLGDGHEIDHEALNEACSDETAHLVLEPLRWALALSPRLICCEQVPPALPVWEAMEPILRARGYSTWSGVLSAEQFGVPQTRKRAFLIASLDGPVSMPTPMHQRYVAPRSRDDEGGGLFDLPEPERIVAPGDARLLPWVSMAEALGWADGPAPSPAPTVTSGGAESGGVEVFASRGARARARGAVLVNPYNRPNSAERTTDEPAPTVLSGNDFGERVWKYDPRQTGAAPRPVEEPAPTMLAEGLAKGVPVWTPAALRKAPYGEGMVERYGDREPVEVDRPAPAITSKARSAELVGERPATTLAGDQRVFQPGGHHTPGAQSENAVRVSIEQAACLQSFPAGYPWEAAGSRSAAFRCIGNAVPPLLARAVLAEALSSVREMECVA